MRFVIVHYHIFKNAGSSVDYILQKSFGENWVAYDTNNPAARIAPKDMEQVIVQNPFIQAISSHQLRLPLMDLKDVDIFPIVFFRHPLDRARSIYDFERKQGITLGPVSKGADHASRLAFSDYLQWRYSCSKNGVVHNHQTLWLLYEGKYWNRRITEKDFERACEQLKSLRYFGIVEHFNQSIDLLNTNLESYGVMLDADYLIVNGNAERHESLDRRLDLLREGLGEVAWSELVERNMWDCLLYEKALEEFKLRWSARSQVELHI